MNFLEAIKACFAKYATFSGRARRSEFWWFYLLTCIPSWCMSALVQWKTAKVAELTAAALQDMSQYNEVLAQAESFDTIFYLGLAVFGLISLALLIPTLAVWVRRLHDVGKSGHMLWLCLLCGIGGLIPLIMCISDSKPGPNQYGPNPKEV
ncbi:MAG: DUF805 domain-containing protein [Muribaculaceae bacterium]|nr:DUF805 domain-containing protein [Muribaculaceae bacterium]